MMEVGNHQQSLSSLAEPGLSFPSPQPVGDNNANAPSNSSNNSTENVPQNSEEEVSAAMSTQEKMSRALRKRLREKDRQWKALSQRKGPLKLLELPVDILRLIVKEITHTNDLTALALTNSALYSLVVPLIYARFDIVWPDQNVPSSDSKSVDALTYGLSTLCLGSAFARTTHKLFNSPTADPYTRFVRNDYARYTRKFSLGNGPKDWVSEYMISKESGKMLGTLVAIAISKMINLETFIWDMPTGVLSDVFMALASLSGQADNDCKLDRVWVRWHDNRDNTPALANGNPTSLGTSPHAVVPMGSTLTPVGILLPVSANHPVPRPAVPYAQHHVEYPTFSVLPPLKSLSVLEIDEVAYLDEMAMLIERSMGRLKELRVGIAARASHKDFVQTWDGSSLKQVDHKARWPGESTIGERRLGGVMGILVGRVYDIRRRVLRVKGRSYGINGALQLVAPHTPPTLPVPPALPTLPTLPTPATNQSAEGGEAWAPDAASTTQSAASGQPESNETGLVKLSVPPTQSTGDKANAKGRKRLDGRLKLQTLELERVPLSMQVCRYAIDWTVLTSLTILECAQHENLWRMLRKQFQPTAMVAGFGISASNSRPPPANAPLQYHLALKQIHADMTTPSLIALIKETLAPNSLEVLFLQDRRRSGPPQVTIDQIFKGALKRHRSSLRKLLLDSSVKAPPPPPPPPVVVVQQANNGIGAAAPAAAGAGAGAGAGPGMSEYIHWRNWVLTSEIVLYITSGRMSNLQELAMALDYKDWHTFLQRLPNIPHVRSLYIPFIADHPIGNFDPKELALQMIDIITLRPEIELCYVGIGPKCFEILETRDPASGKSGSAGFDPSHLSNGINGGGAGSDDDDNDDDDDDDEEDDTSDEEGNGAQGNGTGPGEDGDGVGNDAEETADNEDEVDGDTPATATDPDETQSDAGSGDGGVSSNGSGAEAKSDGGDDDDDNFVEPATGGVRLRLREILFYDDKIAIFKARHAKL